MNATTIVQVVAGALFLVMLTVLVQRRRNRAR